MNNNDVNIVIVDDSPFSISILKGILEEKGFNVVGQASSLEETIKVIKEKRPTLVTMDMTIPGTDGLECTRAIHEIDESIKVVVVSSMMDDEIVEKSKKNKVSGYVQKPVDPEELVTTIERILYKESLFDELKSIYLDVFKESFLDNINRIAKTKPSYEEIKNSNTNESSRGISAVVGIIGMYSGRLIFDLSYETSKKLTEFIFKKEVTNMEECLAMSGELANIVAGNACSTLNKKDKAYGLRVSPPAIFHGKSLNMANTILNTSSIVFNTDFGDIYLNIGFKRGDEEWTQI